MAHGDVSLNSDVTDYGGPGQDDKWLWTSRYGVVTCIVLWQLNMNHGLKWKDTHTEFVREVGIENTYVALVLRLLFSTSWQYVLMRVFTLISISQGCGHLMNFLFGWSCSNLSNHNNQEVQWETLIGYQVHFVILVAMWLKSTKNSIAI